MPACCICGELNEHPVYKSVEPVSLTTMLRLYDQFTVVYFCSECGHLQTTPVVAMDDYYAHQYAILAESNDEDQLYKIINGQKVFQVPHRLETMLRKVELPQRAQVLDYGCAKGALLSRLKSQRSDITPYFFDVTDRYLPFWRQFAHSDQWAIEAIPNAWRDRFDAVCSFYVLEHVADPPRVVAQMAGLLKPGGILYFIVPNVLNNAADFVVADHLQHYSVASITRLLADCGLELIEIDDAAHDAALIVVARRASKVPILQQVSRPSDHLLNRYQEVSRFWSELGSRVRKFESRNAGQPATIYGAGFYGNFIWANLADRCQVSQFVDQNPYLQGRTMQGVPIIPPTELPLECSTMYVGLNPAAAKSVIGEIECWRGRTFDSFYL